VSQTGCANGQRVENRQPAGIDCGATCTAAFPAFQRIFLLPVPDPGSEFVNWNGTADCLDGDLIRLPGEDASCVAVFDAIVVPPSVETLTVVVSGPGTVRSSPTGILCREGETCSEDFATGALVSLGARPAGGGTFLGWSGDCTGTFPLVTVTLDAAKTCTATFQP